MKTFLATCLFLVSLLPVPVCAADYTEPMTGMEFAEFIKLEIAKWGRVVRDAGLKAN